MYEAGVKIRLDTQVIQKDEVLRIFDLSFKEIERLTIMSHIVYIGAG